MNRHNDFHGVRVPAASRPPRSMRSCKLPRRGLITRCGDHQTRSPRGGAGQNANPAGEVFHYPRNAQRKNETDRGLNRFQIDARWLVAIVQAGSAKSPNGELSRVSTNDNHGSPKQCAASGELRVVSWPRLFDQEALDLLARFDSSLQPERLEAAAGPGLRRLFRIAILRRDRSQWAAAASRFSSSARIMTRQVGKLCLKHPSACDDLLADRGIHLAP
jgi:hypothetical protein